MGKCIKYHKWKYIILTYLRKSPELERICSRCDRKEIGVGLIGEDSHEETLFKETNKRSFLDN